MTTNKKENPTAHDELLNIANAKHFDRERFADDTEFADWAQNRARAVLAAQPKPLAELTAAARDVLAERRRQVQVEGWTPEHDDCYRDRDLAAAAACYATHAASRNGSVVHPPIIWPWNTNHWKPTTPRRDLVKAAALILAEIERLDRAGASR
jgi:hypothetical protein